MAVKRVDSMHCYGCNTKISSNYTRFRRFVAAIVVVIVVVTTDRPTDQTCDRRVLWPSRKNQWRHTTHSLFTVKVFCKHFLHNGFFAPKIDSPLFNCRMFSIRLFFFRFHSIFINRCACLPSYLIALFRQYDAYASLTADCIKHIFFSHKNRIFQLFSKINPR